MKVKLAPKSAGNQAPSRSLGFVRYHSVPSRKPQNRSTPKTFLNIYEGNTSTGRKVEECVMPLGTIKM